MANPFYSSEQTERSRAVLAEIVRAVPDAVLIGGWGTWVRTGGAMSHDIDLIVTRQQLAVLASIAEELSESSHLAGTKWRGSRRGIHLDLYAPYQSRLGANLQLRVEDLLAHAERHRGWRVLTAPAHTATKLAALLDRPDSRPGAKDRSEVLALLADPASERAATVIAEASARTPGELDKLLGAAFQALSADADLDRAARARLRTVERSWRATVRSAPASPTLDSGQASHRLPPAPPGPRLSR